MEISNKNKKLHLYRQDGAENSEDIYYVKADLKDGYLYFLSALISNSKSEDQVYPINYNGFNGVCQHIYDGDTFCIWVYEPYGFFHIICNNTVFAWRVLNHCLFHSRKSFGISYKDIKVDSKWTNDGVIVGLFVMQYLDLMRKQYPDDDFRTIDLIPNSMLED